MTSIVLVGGGGHCKSCIEVINSDGRYRIEGVVDNQYTTDDKCLGIPYIGRDEDLKAILTKFKMALVTVGQIKNYEVRKNLFEMIKALGAQMPIIQASSSIISSQSKIGEGTIVMHGAIVNACAEIGKNVIINSMALIEHDVHIGNHCHISTGARINGNVNIADGCFVGSGAVLHQNISVGKNAIIAAGAIISKDVAEGEFVRVIL